MEIGTADPTIDEKIIKTRRPVASSGGGSGPKGGGGYRGPDSGGSGGPGSDLPPVGEDSINRDKSRIITWFLLLVVLMTFGGLAGAYVMVSTNRALEWQPFDLPFQVWISTFIILASSISLEVGRRAIVRNDLQATRRYLAATTIFGAFFISSQLIVWLALVDRGLYMRGNPYAGFFYIITAVHALHVLGGIVALGATLLRSWYPSTDPAELEYRRNLGRSVSLYWHFMGVLWIGLFLMLTFWK